MKSKRIVLMALIAFSSGFAVADNSVHYRYAGSSVGKQEALDVTRWNCGSSPTRLVRNRFSAISPRRPEL